MKMRGAVTTLVSRAQNVQFKKIDFIIFILLTSRLYSYLNPWSGLQTWISDNLTSFTTIYYLTASFIFLGLFFKLKNSGTYTKLMLGFSVSLLADFISYFLNFPELKGMVAFNELFYNITDVFIVSLCIYNAVRLKIFSEKNIYYENK